MTAFTTKIPVNYEFPYKHMLHDIAGQIQEYSKRRGIGPNFIVIASDDLESLLAEMISFKLLVPGRPAGKLQFQGIRIIESPDVMKGFFEVLGN